MRAHLSAGLLAVAVALGGCTSTTSPDRTSAASTSHPPLVPPATAPTGIEVDRQVAAALDAEFSSLGYEDLLSVIVVVDGRTTYERYYASEAAAFHHVYSVTKSVVSTLVGIAIGQDLISGVDATLAELLPAHAGQMSREVSRITLEQLLTMTGGFVDAAVPSGAGRIEHILTDGHTAVTSFLDSTSSADLVSAILAETTGMSTLAYARQTLFDPLGIPATPAEQPDVSTIAGVLEIEAAEHGAVLGWATDADGTNLGGTGLRLRAQDMAKIGLMYLDDGAWEGQQIVPADWIHAATSTRVPAPRRGYGYLWWVDGDGGYRAVGSGGQRIIVDPARRLVLVAQAWVDTADPDGWREAEVLGSLLDLTYDSIITPAYASEGA